MTKRQFAFFMPVICSRILTVFLFYLILYLHLILKVTAHGCKMREITCRHVYKVHVSLGKQDFHVAGM